MTSDEFRHSANQLLSSLPASDLALLEPHLRAVSFEQGATLYLAGDELDHVYFPCAGVVSQFVMLADGKAVETAMTGCEGGVGLLAGLGLHRPHTSVVAQLPVTALRVSAAGFRAAAQSSRPLCELIVRDADRLLSQTQITAACNALHSIEERLARWILQVSAYSDGDSVPLTQQHLSQMLGVTRSSVSEAAGKLQAAGLIRYSRGSIDITDRRGLEQSACDCYGALLDRLARR